MNNEDALNYEKTLQRIGGVGIAPVPVEISLACIAAAMVDIRVELQRMNVTAADNHNRISAIVSQMQSSANQISNALNGSTGMIGSTMSRVTQMLEELKNAKQDAV